MMEEKNKVEKVNPLGKPIEVKDEKKERNVYFELIDRLVLAALLLFVVSVGSFIYYRMEYKLYFANTSYQYDTTIVDTPVTGEFRTSIEYDKKYVNDNVQTENDAINLIINESEIQKKKCANNKNLEVEKRIQSKYKIAAVNLCELDPTFAKEIEKVIDHIYKEYPGIGGYMSNLTLMNSNVQNGVMASFQYAFIFSTSSRNRGYPWVVKNQIVLNSEYFLDPNLPKIISDSSKRVREGDISWFPLNANRTSVVAHEFGHYLSFVALNKKYNTDERFLIKKMNYSNYNKMVSDYSSGVWAKSITDEAYENYNSKHPGKFESEYEFRASISKYAVAIDGRGNFIYDETIAESFHDYYINGNKAADASKEVVKVLKERLK